MIIHVTQDHIDYASPCDRCNCPIAMALKDYPAFQCNQDSYGTWAFNGAGGVWNTVITIFIKREPIDEYILFEHNTRVILPEEAQNFIKYFDEYRDNIDEPPQPFSFHLSAECFML